MNALDEARALQRKCEALARREAAVIASISARYDAKRKSLFLAASPAALRVLDALTEIEARAALALIPKEETPLGDVIGAMADVAESLKADREADEPPDQIQVPAALREPYKPSERLTGRARER